MLHVFALFYELHRSFGFWLSSLDQSHIIWNWADVWYSCLLIICWDFPLSKFQVRFLLRSNRYHTYGIYANKCWILQLYHLHTYISRYKVIWSIFVRFYQIPVTLRIHMHMYFATLDSSGKSPDHYFYLHFGPTKWKKEAYLFVCLSDHLSIFCSYN